MVNKAIPLRQLGKNGPMVSALGFGLMVFSINYYGVTPDDETRFKILDRAYEMGARFWDTSEYALINTVCLLT